MQIGRELKACRYKKQTPPCFFSIWQYKRALPGLKCNTKRATAYSYFLSASCVKMIMSFFWCQMPKHVPRENFVVVDVRKLPKKLFLQVRVSKIDPDQSFAERTSVSVRQKCQHESAPDSAMSQFPGLRSQSDQHAFTSLKRRSSHPPWQKAKMDIVYGYDLVPNTLLYQERRFCLSVSNQPEHARAL